MFYPDYQKATNKACEVLIDYNLSSLPIDLTYLIHSLPPNICVKSYWDLMNRFNFAYGELIPIMPSEKGFFAYKQKKNSYLIYYNNFKDTETIRFTIAHELGHYFLEHIEDNETTDKEANCFARNLLSPYPVIASSHLTTPESISLSCGISEVAAQVRLKLKNLDYYWVSRDLYQALIHRFDCEEIYMLYA